MILLKTLRQKVKDLQDEVSKVCIEIAESENHPPKQLQLQRKYSALQDELRKFDTFLTEIEKDLSE